MKSRRSNGRLNRSRLPPPWPLRPALESATEVPRRKKVRRRTVLRARKLPQTRKPSLLLLWWILCPVRVKRCPWEMRRASRARLSQPSRCLRSRLHNRVDATERHFSFI
uniref:(northern house mosquito) hypothetical protein n=1 Tax=Culex pipiens TaxID=7175 RepID=A0A8D8KLF5_CULPI